MTETDVTSNRTVMRKMRIMPSNPKALRRPSEYINTQFAAANDEDLTRFEWSLFNLGNILAEIASTPQPIAEFSQPNASPTGQPAARLSGDGKPQKESKERSC